jgi:hypothetical protein
MIVVRIAGGLGNQMLQYALGKNLSLKNNSPLWLDLSWFKNHSNSPFFRDFKLNNFHTDCRKISLDKLIWKLRFTDHFSFCNPFKLKNVKEKEYARFDESILQSGNDILLEGFFPSHKYFEEIRDVLLKDFSLCVPLNNINKECLERIKNTNSVSVHFRRGDYALTGYHQMLDSTYYNAAIKSIAEKISDIRLFIFSDEPGWVAQNINFEYPFELMTFNKDEHNYFDLELMKHCKHNIIANSTFSWWGAWLGQYQGKVVIAPKNWLNLEIGNMQNIPEQWILV